MTIKCCIVSQNLLLLTRPIRTIGGHEDHMICRTDICLSSLSETLVFELVRFASLTTLSVTKEQ